ncbi:IS200/IS605 family transposase [Bacillus thuringiensis]|uniref:IS200/IS605 family transposase n=1 Tax=Bacillus thuringiensis TaxID=1428 RepID=UPI0034592F65
MDFGQVFTEQIAHRVREIIEKCCLTCDITIIKGSVGKNYIHLLISSLSTIASSKIIQYFKGRSLKLLQQECSQWEKQYWGRHLWARGYCCATVGTVNEETIRKYVESQQSEHDDVFDVQD